MSFSETDWLCTHYQLDGAANLPTLVLSNSLGTQLAMWDPQMREFARYFRVLRYDTRGHGRSSVPVGPYSIGQMGEDVFHLLDKLAVEQFCFCGLSLGGMVGQWLGVHAAHRVTKLVLANTAMKIGTVESWNARIDAVCTGGMEFIAALVGERWFTPAFRAANPHVVSELTAMLDSTDSDGYVASCAAIRDMDQSEDVRCIRSPTLVIGGTQDSVTPCSDGALLAEAIPGARFVAVEAAHLSNVEAAGCFTNTVLDFLRSE
jgi:3-oxoadipate enol-lactonase